MIVNGRLSFENLTGDPTVPSPVEGDLYYNSTDKGMKLYDGSSWNAVGGGSITYQTVVGTSNATHTSTGYGDIPEMTLTTAEAGTYLITASVSLRNTMTSNSVNSVMQLMIAGVGVARSRGGMFHAGSNGYYLEEQFVITWVATLSQNDIVKLQWKTASGSMNSNCTADDHRCLTITKLA